MSQHSTPSEAEYFKQRYAGKLEDERMALEEAQRLIERIARLEAQNKALCEICAAFVQSLNPEAIYPGMMRIDNVGLQKIIKQARAAIEVQKGMK